VPAISSFTAAKLTLSRCLCAQEAVAHLPGLLPLLELMLVRDARRRPTIPDVLRRCAFDRLQFRLLCKSLEPCTCC